MAQKNTESRSPLGFALATVADREKLRQDVEEMVSHIAAQNAGIAGGVQRMAARVWARRNARSHK
jgi:hypothetical protein